MIIVFRYRNANWGNAWYDFTNFKFAEPIVLNLSHNYEKTGASNAILPVSIQMHMPYIIPNTLK